MNIRIKAWIFIGLISSYTTQSMAEVSMTVYKTPSCGCCQKWVDHLTENGIQTNVIALSDLAPIKSKHGVQGRYRSCHTGLVATEYSEGKHYIFEGHIPAKYVEAFLANPPAGAFGLSVPGMPVGSPGMEVGDRLDYYQVLQLNEDGSSSVYAHVNQ
ncbi:DUF411 domain-containing protein [Arenicella xantha]|uniref:Metal-binding protein n=1 Tax=Arenicella xantha TaxID=644221 RepID=A0A395JLZ8_9GAMM|nr:DUF411 domain-containing protein [Arenicella xantha]RBP50688.1 hypothetical protein DFR28_10299 [Arenicella xantha]